MSSDELEESDGYRLLYYDGIKESLVNAMNAIYNKEYVVAETAIKLAFKDIEQLISIYKEEQIYLKNKL